MYIAKNLYFLLMKALQNVVESVVTMRQLLEVIQGADLATLTVEAQNMIK
jgi:hypothetical protein